MNVCIRVEATHSRDSRCWDAAACSTDLTAQFCAVDCESPGMDSQIIYKEARTGKSTHAPGTVRGQTQYGHLDASASEQYIKHPSKGNFVRSVSIDPLTEAEPAMSAKICSLPPAGIGPDEHRLSDDVRQACGSCSQSLVCSYQTGD